MEVHVCAKERKRKREIERANMFAREITGESRSSCIVALNN